MVNNVNITGTHIILVFVVLTNSLLFMLHQLPGDFKFLCFGKKINKFTFGGNKDVLLGWKANLQKARYIFRFMQIIVNGA